MSVGNFTNTNVPIQPIHVFANPSPTMNETIHETGIKLQYYEYCQLKALIEKHSRNFLKIGLHNARSLVGNIENYRSFIANSELNVFAVVETWLKSSNTNKSVELNGYTIIRSDRRDKKKTRGGGVAFYVKKNIKYSVISKSEDGNGIDYLFIKLKHANLVCGVIYKPPDVNVTKLDGVFNLIAEISSTEPNVLIMGDFNVNLLVKNSYKATKMAEYLSSLSLKLVNTFPTCHKSEFSSVIDLFAGNCLSNVNNVYQSSVGGISDHDFICVDYKYKHSKANSEVYWTREYHKVDTFSFLSDLRNISFDRVFYCANVDEKLRLFNRLFFEILDRHAPLRKKTVRDPNNPWITNQIERLFKNRSDAYECWKRDKSNSQKWANFTRLRNLANNKVKSTKREFFASQLNADLPAKQLWRNIKRLGLKQTNTKMGGGDITAGSLNVFFVTQTVPFSFSHNHDSFELPSRFSFTGVTADEVLAEFASASCDAVGNDLIPLKMLKASLSVTLPCITDIFNSCITTSEFPIDWKTAKVIPIGKTDNPSTEKDYRPISILCALSKIFESIMYNQLNSYLIDNNLLNTFQSGYRRSCSTVTALIKIDSDIREAIDKKLVTVMVLLDFSKAFDSIDHRLLCHKLKHNFHLDHYSVDLIQSYLSNRMQYVDFNNQLSDKIPVASGVPQGSILGPLLFSIFINDLPLSILNCKFHLYADDCQLYLSGLPTHISDIVNKVNNDIRRIVEWCGKNGLLLNAKKTQAIIFRTKRSNMPHIPLILVENRTIEYTKVVKNLGLLMDCNLDWNAQINAVCSKIYSSLHSLVLLRYCTPQHIRVQLARSLIVPLFDYGDVLFSLTSKKNSKKLNLAFNSVIRYAYNLKKYDHLSRYKTALLGCEFTNHLKLRMSIQTYKILNDPPNYLKNFFNHTRSSRSSSLIVPRCHIIQKNR